MDINKKLSDISTKIKNLNIPLSDKIKPVVQINYRAKARLGCCIYKNGEYTIEISEFIMSDENLLEQTLAHELLHTCYGCRNHGDRWKSYAKRVSEMLGHKIERTVKLDRAERLRSDEIKYMLICNCCNAEIKRSRMSNVVKYPNRYRCKCGGTLKRVE